MLQQRQLLLLAQNLANDSPHHIFDTKCKRSASLQTIMQRHQTPADRIMCNPQTKQDHNSPVSGNGLAAGLDGRPKDQRRDSILEDNAREHPLRKDAPATSRPADMMVPKRACACLDCRPDLYLQTTHAHELQRFWRTTHQLGLFQHDCLQLAELAIASFDGSADLGHSHKTSGRKPENTSGCSPGPPGLLSFAQHHAIRRWKQWLCDPEAQAWRVSPDLSKYNPNSILHTPMVVFNELFFLGQLPVPAKSCGPDVLNIQWSPPGTNRRAHSHAFAECDSPLIQSIIWINPNHPSHFLNPRARLNTLVHELSHAFLQRFSCYNGGGEGCDRNQVCVELCQENYGATGHGRAWQRLTAAIEETAPRLLGGLRVDLGRNEGAVREMERMGAGWWPTDRDLETFSDEFGWRVRALMRSRDDDRAVVERVRSWVLKGRLCPKERPRSLRRRSSI